ncbi:MAG: SDR family NAD(P)-dependent oxidoreductase [Leptolyngbyaceae cyanobacterium CSU_1_4]|nr:SDR family NAD(P)-dependent oxidoreductase [Leptolyngbyaceae cyanobacterium CSU_1_4]
MQQAKHIGKIVVTQNPSVAQDPVQPVQIRPDVTYLISGGLGGLGLLVADWLIQQGAKHLVLISRRSPTPQVNIKVQAWERSDVQIRIVQADIAETHIMQQILSDVEATMPPLRGVIHAAGILNDGTLRQLTAEQMTAVLCPKIAGAWNLHTLVQQPLDFFVLFSSATALLGSPGQANHVAANTFLDALSNYRRAIGKPAVSINWGIWSEIGSAADRLEQMNLKGIGTIAPHQGIEIFAQLLQQNAPQVGVMPMQWSTFLAQGITDPFFADFAHTKVAPSTLTPVFLQQLQATAREKQRSLLEQHIRHQIAQVLGCQATEIDAQKGFFDLGMDSLTSVELKNRLQNSLNCSLSATLIFDYPTLEALLDYLAIQLINELNRPESDQSPLTEVTPDNSLDELTQDELADLLAQELNEIAQGAKQ